MDDEHSAERRQLEGLRLIRTFLRIEDADQRALIIDFAERLMHEPVSSIPERSDGLLGGSPDGIQDR